MYDRTDSSWWPLIRPLCHPELQNDSNGRERFLKGLDDGRGRLEHVLKALRAETSDPEVIPSLKTLGRIHYFLYADVYPFAGKLRDIALPREKARGISAPENIERDLERLEREAKRCLETATSTDLRCRLISAHAARLVQIQPFFAETSEVARQVAGEQRRSLLGEEPKLALDEEHYLEALANAIRKGDLGPLSYALTERSLTGELARTPFHVGLVLHQGRQGRAL
jgi:hypothetical protein